MKFKIGDKVRYNYGHLTDSLKPNFGFIVDLNKFKQEYCVMWHGSTKPTFAYKDYDLIAVIEPNDILKEIL